VKRDRVAQEAGVALRRGLNRLARVLLREKDGKADRRRMARGEEVEVADEAVLFDRHIDQRIAHRAGLAFDAEA
jgi:poly(3-hydroxyalkanoate) synthetase